MTRHIFLRMILYFLCLLSTGCHFNTLQEYRKAARQIILELAKEFHEVHSLEDLVKRAPKLKKKMRHLTAVMIEAENYHRKHPDEELEKGEHPESDQLFYEMLRISEEVEGAKDFLEELQSETLDKLDVNERKAGRL